VSAMNGLSVNCRSVLFISRRIILVLAIVVIAAACSSQRELTRDSEEKSEEQTATIATIKTTEPYLERPVLVIDSLPPVPDIDLADFESILDRARLYTVLAQKALEQGDTLAAIEKCEIASQKIDRASYYPNMEDSQDFIDLSRQIVVIYQRSAHGIPASTLDVSISALQFLVDESVEHTEEEELVKISFRSPPPTTIPLPLNEEVEKNIVFFTTKGRKFFTKWLERSGRYFPVMEPILAAEGVPDELIYLTMIESGVNPTARSWAKCVGLWQFLRSTGEAYGLRGDWYYDDRRNPEKATRAAGRHLRDLYNKYDDWHLALAAYNAGAGRIDRAIRKSKVDSPDYWTIRKYLPKETQNYVPRYIATTIIALNPDAYDFVDLEYQMPFDISKVSVNRSLLDEDLAECVGIPVELFHDLNPHLLQNVTPPDSKRFDIYIPRHREQTFASNLDAIPEAQESGVVKHRVKSGESLSSIARKYAVTIRDLKDANGIRKKRYLRVGEMLAVPSKTIPRDNASSKIAKDNLKRSSAKKYDDPALRTRGKEQIVLLVQKGMTLGGLANHYSVKVHDLLTWNSMKADDALQVGQKLKVWVKPANLKEIEQNGNQIAAELVKQEEPAASTVAEPVKVSQKGSTIRHTVKNGETLHRIARDYRVSVQDLVAWNELKSEMIHPGSKIEIRSGQSSKQSTRKMPAATAKREPVSRPSTKRVIKGTEIKHEVQSGETLWSIAARYDVQLRALRVANGLKNDGIRLGQKLTIPGTDINNSADVAKKGDGKYTVQKGDNLWTIAKSAGIHIDSIRTWNKLRRSNVHPGQILLVRNPESIVKMAGTNEDEGIAGTISYEVKPGDNLHNIAVKLGVNIDDLKKTNGLHSDAIVVGQKLIVYSSDLSKNKPTETLSKTLEAGMPLTKQEYVVSEGDTLYGISRKLGVNITDLKKWNKVGQFLQTGQRLVYYAQ
jgi:peptidoglycan lytic transglycosylase D